MDVKSTFLNGHIKGDVYVEQPSDFEDGRYPHHLFKLKKVLYGLKQASIAWYERLRQCNKGVKGSRVTLLHHTEHCILTSIIIIQN
jgi:hypothetical protein